MLPALVSTLGLQPFVPKPLLHVGKHTCKANIGQPCCYRHLHLILLLAWTSRWWSTEQVVRTCQRLLQRWHCGEQHFAATAFAVCFGCFFLRGLRVRMHTTHRQRYDKNMLSVDIFTSSGNACSWSYGHNHRHVDMSMSHNMCKPATCRATYGYRHPQSGYGQPIIRNIQRQRTLLICASRAGQLPCTIRLATDADMTKARQLVLQER